MKKIKRKIKRNKRRNKRRKKKRKGEKVAKRRKSKRKRRRGMGVKGNLPHPFLHSRELNVVSNNYWDATKHHTFKQPEIPQCIAKGREAKDTRFHFFNVVGRTTLMQAEQFIVKVRVVDDFADAPAVIHFLGVPFGQFPFNRAAEVGKDVPGIRVDPFSATPVQDSRVVHKRRDDHIFPGVETLHPRRNVAKVLNEHRVFQPSWNAPQLRVGSGIFQANAVVVKEQPNVVPALAPFPVRIVLLDDLDCIRDELVPVRSSRAGKPGKVGGNENESGGGRKQEISIAAPTGVASYAGGHKGLPSETQTQSPTPS